ncbi:hypothetical protein BJ165DRAFT_1518719 [Panaeolus papilionaceus]|nr:hypothetical protein BJ165DRAFT_1518719 [Panaeolus papilionaceus]
MALMNRPPNRLLLAAIILVVFTSLLVWYKDLVSLNFKPSHIPSSSNSPSSSSTSSSACSPSKSYLVGEKSLADLRTLPQKRRRVAIASTFGYHFDVYVALAWTMQRVMGKPPNSLSWDVGGSGSVVVYSPEKFRFGFDNIVDMLGLYKGDVRPSENLFDDLDMEVDGRKVELVVLGTCEVDLRDGTDSWHRRLLAAWDKRREDEKFMVVCIVHNVQDTHWQTQITDWARRGAIRFLPISQHVANSFRTIFLTHADSTSDPQLRLAGYEYLKLDTHVPILNLSASHDLWLGSKPNAPLDPDIELSGIDSGSHSSYLDGDGRKPEPDSLEGDGGVKMGGRKLSRAVIQGSFSSDRREYPTVFRELINSLSEDPSVWGYLPRAQGQDRYVVDPKEKDPFYLYLLGSGGIDIPKELEDMVIVKKDLSYGEFYRLMQTMDICVPAFNPDNGYYRFQASSTMVMALQCNVPILATHRVRSSYAYADDDKVMITRPAVISEVAALRALRIGNMTSFWDHYTQLSHTDTPGGGGSIDTSLPSHSARVYSDLEKMMNEGWRRSARGFAEFREDLWMENERVVEMLLRDL